MNRTLSIQRLAYFLIVFIVEILENLLEAGADVNICCRWDYQPIERLI